MILFFSNTNDISSRKVLEWLFKAKRKVLVINNIESHFIDLEYLSDKKLCLNINGLIVDVNKVSAVYFRRGGKILKMDLKLQSYKTRRLDVAQKTFLNYLLSNEITKDEIISSSLYRKKVFGNENIGRTNKYLALMAAKKVGLNIPKTILSGSKEELRNFKEKFQKVICKSMDLTLSYYDGKYSNTSYTCIIDDKIFEGINQQFALTLFQEYIEKDFEVRCFCFHQKFFAVAYFSQVNDKTRTDYRRYDDENPNRQVPVIIPNDLKSKILRLLKELQINTGSLDIISRNGKYYFLEVNPVGIFDNVSIFGNWYIEKEIAEYLNGETKVRKR